MLSPATSSPDEVSFRNSENDRWPKSFRLPSLDAQSSVEVPAPDARRISTSTASSSSGYSTLKHTESEVDQSLQEKMLFEYVAAKRSVWDESCDDRGDWVIDILVLLLKSAAMLGAGILHGKDMPV